MTILRIENTTIVSLDQYSQTSYLTSSDPSSLESILNRAPDLLSPFPLDFFIRDDSRSIWEDLVILVDDSSKDYVVRIWPTEGPSVDHIVYPVITAPSADTRYYDIELPNDAVAMLQRCNLVAYNSGFDGTPGTTFGAITSREGASGTIYSLAYDFFTSTTRYVRGQILANPGDLFDSSEIVPNPFTDGSYWWLNTMSPLHMEPLVPDIFWTRRTLCVEDV